MSTSRRGRGRLPLPVAIVLFVVAFLVFRWFVGTAASMRADSVEAPSRHLRLELPEGGARATISQHATAPLPGSNGVLEVSLGDITAGQVRITLVDPGREVLLERVSVREGERVPFTYASHGYVVEVIELNNRRVGNDEAIIGVMYADAR